MKKTKKKSRPVKILEYLFARLLISLICAIHLKGVRLISSILGGLLYFGSRKRRAIALENLQHAFSGEKDDAEITRMARECCTSFIFTFLEIIKLRRRFAAPDTINRFVSATAGLETLFLKAKKIHDESGGCIFVTPHIGNWEILPHVSAAVGIPLVIVARPLDNEYLHKLIFESRSTSGHFIIPKKNAVLALQKTLQQGKSIGMLPDQSTMKGVSIDFFGRKALTTPVPALLAITYKRPIVVMACCRKAGDYQYEGFISDPVMPGEFTSKKEEIIRITGEMTKKMEDIIRKYPEQYLWIHNRWKTYRGKKEFLAD